MTDALRLYRGRGGPVKAGATERVAARLLAAGDAGMTREELSLATGLNSNTVRSSVYELEQAGRVTSGPDTRPTVAGHQAHVVRANDKPQVKLFNPPPDRKKRKKHE